MELNNLKEVRSIKGTLVDARNLYFKKHKPGEFVRISVYSNPLVYHIAILKYNGFKYYDRLLLSIKKKDVDKMATLYDLIKRSLLSDMGEPDSEVALKIITK